MCGLPVIGLFLCMGFSQAPTAGANSGGVNPGAGDTGRRPPRAKLVGGRAVAPASAPARVKRAIAAANRIAVGKPYCYGGGHGDWDSACYDCSGSVSYALGPRGAGLIQAPMASGGLARWGRPRRGRWISVYANGGHAYAVIAGLRFDTSMTAGRGPGWSRRDLRQGGYRVRHPRGL
jgi:hypothetical protein